MWALTPHPPQSKTLPRRITPRSVHGRNARKEIRGVLSLKRSAEHRLDSLDLTAALIRAEAVLGAPRDA